MNKNSTLVKANRNDFKTNSKFKDLRGKIFGYLTVIDIFGYRQYPNGLRKWVWECLCECNVVRYCATGELESNISYSCGCRRYGRQTPNQKYDPNEAAYRAKAANYKASAKQRQIEYQLTIEETVKLIKSNCYYCGVSPSNTYSLLRNRSNKSSVLNSAIQEKHKLIFYNGIDRIVNEQGYTVTNTVPCCKICNQAKMDFSLTQFYTWIDRLVLYRSKNVNKN